MDKPTHVIYKITNPDGKVYIGQTVNLKNRLASYKRGNCSNQPKIHASLKKYGFDSHNVEILDYCYESDALKIEKHYIAQYDSNKKGLNSSPTGRKSLSKRQ